MRDRRKWWWRGDAPLPLSGERGVVVAESEIDPVRRQAVEYFAAGVWLRLTDGGVRFVPLAAVDPDVAG